MRSGACGTRGLAVRKQKIVIAALNAFVRKAGGGNPAGVVLDADFLDKTAMQKTAARAGMPETAFVQKSAAADFNIRFFTPAAEVDLCGHATIAAFSLLFGLGRIRAGRYSQETKAGILGVEVQEDGTVSMEQTLPVFGNAFDGRDIASSLGKRPDSLAPDLPVQIAFTGLPDIMVPIVSLRELSSLEPDLEKIADISKRHGSVGYHAFSLETKYGSTAHCRNFAPLYGIPEEAATGTSSGALACYLFKHGKITERQARTLVFEQGYGMGRPSEILVRLDISDNGITGVHVGGKATVSGEMTIELEEE
jgi:PhzF family phenazine biosynthesis protein